MKAPETIFRTKAHTPPRMSLRHACSVFSSGPTIEGFTFNISYRGIGVELPPTQSDFDARSLKSVYVPDIGRFDVSVRWKRGRKLGLRFVSEQSARSTLDTYFKKSGSFPV
jgi:hypothetical protein